MNQVINVSPLKLNDIDFKKLSFSKIKKDNRVKIQYDKHDFIVKTPKFILEDDIQTLNDGNYLLRTSLEGHPDWIHFIEQLDKLSIEHIRKYGANLQNPWFNSKDIKYFSSIRTTQTRKFFVFFVNKSSTQFYSEGSVVPEFIPNIKKGAEIKAILNIENIWINNSHFNHIISTKSISFPIVYKYDIGLDNSDDEDNIGTLRPDNMMSLKINTQQNEKPTTNVLNDDFAVKALSEHFSLSCKQCTSPIPQPSPIKKSVKPNNITPVKSSKPSLKSDMKTSPIMSSSKPIPMKSLVPTNKVTEIEEDDLDFSE